MNCVICKKKIEGHVNNALPIKKGDCCDKCNLEFVIPARMIEVEERKRKEEQYLIDQPVQFKGRDVEIIECFIDVLKANFTAEVSKHLYAEFYQNCLKNKHLNPNK